MKDIVIKKESVKREIWILLLCFVASYGCNIYAIIHYDRPLSELYNTIGFVIAFAVVLYVALWIVRLIFLLLKYCFTATKSKMKSK